MEFRPIISAMRRNKVGAILIAVQMAITLAILCNALFIIEQRVASSRRPTGADEANVFVIEQSMGGQSTGSGCAFAGGSRGFAVAAGCAGCLCDEYLSAERQRLNRRASACIRIRRMRPPWRQYISATNMRSRTGSQTRSPAAISIPRRWWTNSATRT